MRRFGYALLVLLAAPLTGCGPAGTPEVTPVQPAGGCPDGDRPPTSPLPDDRPVGRATLIYQPRPNWAPVLVTESGAQYLLRPPAPARAAPTAALPDASPLTGRPPAPIPLDPMFGLRLSPDGRWLAQSDYNGVLLRDLTGTDKRRIGRGELGAWSANGRWLVIVSRVPGTDTSTIDLVQVTTGERRPVRLPWGHVLAVLGPDQLLAAHGYNRENGDPDAGRETYAVVDPTTGRIQREITVDSGGQGRADPSATVATGNLLVSVLSSADRAAQDVLAVAVSSGRVLGRHPLPSEAPGGFPAWRVAGISGDQVMLARQVHLGSPSPGTSPGAVPPSPVQLFLMDPVTGELHPSCTLPGHSEMRLPR